MWTFIGFNLHQLTDSKVQLDLNKLNSHGFIDIAGSYWRRHSDDGMAMAERLLKQVYFLELFSEAGNGCCIPYIAGKFISNLRSTEGKTITKVSEEWKRGTARCRQSRCLRLGL